MEIRDLVIRTLKAGQPVPQSQNVLPEVYIVPFLAASHGWLFDNLNILILLYLLQIISLKIFLKNLPCASPWLYQLLSS